MLARAVGVMESFSVPHSLMTTLRDTRSTLLSLRRSILDRGHVGAMRDIDTLLGIALSETERSIATPKPN
jgi:hypothetical protein